MQSLSKLCTDYLSRLKFAFNQFLVKIEMSYRAEHHPRALIKIPDSVFLIREENDIWLALGKVWFTRDLNHVFIDEIIWGGTADDRALPPTVIRRYMGDFGYISDLIRSISSLEKCRRHTTCAIRGERQIRWLQIILV